ncbi:MAG: hypothetical protein M1483_08670 [Actinobacteria bacterium]|nr:hypothetical protein [Actinomycetota bacterium]MCL6105675.1 hypothetical protein [Actinomycetota bacterium]
MAIQNLADVHDIELISPLVSMGTGRDQPGVRADITEDGVVRVGLRGGSPVDAGKEACFGDVKPHPPNAKAASIPTPVIVVIFLILILLFFLAVDNFST